VRAGIGSSVPIGRTAFTRGSPLRVRSDEWRMSALIGDGVRTLHATRRLQAMPLPALQPQSRARTRPVAATV
jgi:hypothetical protein